ncbi:hypothetical protein [Halorubellus litoreus]|uniref:Uncharacterized protein n=1 Tax=Halorubellus litoreus TaxID=755308 RepID=A0ABD5VIM6_9EURY
MFDGHADGSAEAVRSEQPDVPPLGVKVLLGLTVVSMILLVFSRGPGIVVLAGLAAGVVRIGLLVGLLKMKSLAWVGYLVLEAIFVGLFAFLFLAGSGFAAIEVLFGLLVITYLVSIRDLYRSDAPTSA